MLNRLTDLIPATFCALAATWYAPAARGADFDADGHDDLVIGMPNGGSYTFDDDGYGEVYVLYGGNTGLKSLESDRWSQNKSGMPGQAEVDDRFGQSVAWGDFDEDGFDDLAIGVPGDSAIHILYGSPNGLTTADNQFLTYASFSMPVGIGARLVAGDFNGDGHEDLMANMALYQYSNLPQYAGAILLLYGSDAGLIVSTDHILHEDVDGIDGVAEERDFWGSGRSVAGDFDGDGFDDVAVGSPSDHVKGVSSGSVTILYGSSGGIIAVGSRRVIQSFEHDELGDEFGDVLATGDFDGDGYSDLAVGAPGEDIESVGAIDAGMVAVMYGRATGLNINQQEFWHQDIPGVLGIIRPLEQFGSALATGDFNGDDCDDLAIGSPNTKYNGQPEAGSVNVLYGRQSGLSAGQDQIWFQDSPGIKSASKAAEHFGSALSSSDFDHDGYDDLAVGVPKQNAAFYDDAELGSEGAVNVIYGGEGGLSASGDQFFDENSPGISGAPKTNEGFGSVL